MGVVRASAGRVSRIGIAARRDTAGRGRAGIDSRLGALSRIARHNPRDENLRCLRAIEGAVGQIRVYRRKPLCGCQAAARAQGVGLMANPLRTLNEFGQSVWLAFVSRGLLKGGGLARLIAGDGLRGVGEGGGGGGGVNGRNLMVKVPGTKPGLPAIRTLISEGINVNVTLLFSQQVYAEVAEAYISGLEAFAKKGGDPHKVSSVASFFVSPIDTLVDHQLDKKIAATTHPTQNSHLHRLN